MGQKKKWDQTFKKLFNIETDVVALQSIEIDEKIAKRFQRFWKCFYKRAEPMTSNYRRERFDAFFRQLERDGCDDRYTKRITIRFISSKVGHGVFANEDIPPYSTLIHYVGLLTLDREIDPKHDSTFSFSAIKNYSIDAALRGNWARFMNHAPEKSPANNAVPWEYYTAAGPRIVFTAGAKGIKKGEQILYSYGDDYWKGKRPLSL